MYRKVLLFAFLCIVPHLTAFSQVVIKEDTVAFTIYFKQGGSAFEPEYRDNGRRLKEFVDDIYFREGDPNMSVKKVVVNSGASPEGSEAINEKLSKERAEAIIRYLKEHTALSDSSIIVNSQGVDWKGLAALVEHSDQIPEKDTVLTIIRSEEYGDDDIARRTALENLIGGVFTEECTGTCFRSSVTPASA